MHFFKNPLSFNLSDYNSNTSSGVFFKLVAECNICQMAFLIAGDVNLLLVYSLACIPMHPIRVHLANNNKDNHLTIMRPPFIREMEAIKASCAGCRERLENVPVTQEERAHVERFLAAVQGAFLCCQGGNLEKEWGGCVESELL